MSWHKIRRHCFIYVSFFSYAPLDTLLCARPNRLHYRSCPSVRPSVSPSTYALLTGKQRAEKNKNRSSRALQRRQNNRAGVTSFRLRKGQMSKLRLLLLSSKQMAAKWFMSALGRCIFLVNKKTKDDEVKDRHMILTDSVLQCNKLRLLLDCKSDVIYYYRLRCWKKREMLNVGRFVTKTIYFHHRIGTIGYTCA